MDKDGRLVIVCYFMTIRMRGKFIWIILKKYVLSTTEIINYFLCLIIIHYYDSDWKTTAHKCVHNIHDQLIK